MFIKEEKKNSKYLFIGFVLVTVFFTLSGCPMAVDSSYHLLSLSHSIKTSLPSNYFVLLFWSDIVHSYML